MAQRLPPSTDIRLALRGEEIPLSKYAQAVEQFARLLSALAGLQRGGDAVRWIVVELSSGSARMVVSPESEDETPVVPILQGLAHVATSLSRDIPISDPEIAPTAVALAAVLDGDITSIELSILDEDFEITSRSSVKPSTPIWSYGSIVGDIQTITWRRGFKFTLFDALQNKAVICHASDEQEELVTRMGNRRVIVEGRIRREPETGRATDIYDIEDISPLAYQSGDYEMARGMFPLHPDDPLPEESIRRMRDAW